MTCCWALAVVCACGRIEFEARPDSAVKARDANASADAASADAASADAPLDVAMGPLLVGSGAILQSDVDLTAEGTLDWAIWGMTTTTDFDHKVGGGDRIQSFSTLGGGTAVGFGNTYNMPAPHGFTWSDGMPTLSSGSPQRSGVYVAGFDQGLSISVPADPVLRTLRVYVGGYFSAGQLTVHLSDGSAPDYVDATVGSASLEYTAVYTLTYGSATAGATLVVSWIQTTPGGGIDVNLSAASLQ